MEGIGGTYGGDRGYKGGAGDTGTCMYSETVTGGVSERGRGGMTEGHTFRHVISAILEYIIYLKH